MRCTIVTLLIVLLNSTSALSVPRQPKTFQIDRRWHHSFIKRNDTTADAGELTLNIDPDIVNPQCSGIYEANINVLIAPDPFYLSTACNNVLNYIGGPKGDRDVDVVFACTGQQTAGTGSRDIKVVFNLLTTSINGATSGIQMLSSNMELISEKDNVFISTLVNIGVKMSSSKATFQYIYC